MIPKRLTRDSSIPVISDLGVLAMLRKLDSRKSPGPDCLPNGFLKRYADQLSVFLTRIFQTSLASGEVPYDFLVARVKPLFKSGDKLAISNYRPISITSSCCKMLEHVIAGFIHEFLAERNILSPYQHGFRKKMSTVTQLVTTVHHFSAALDESGQVEVVFLDFSKAFDKVPHDKLLYKLEFIGLPDCILNWIRAYLSNRKQYVDINGCFSHSLAVTSGVPQGSVLGPLLFLLYINDLVSVIPEAVSVRLFADDCIVFREIRSPDDCVVLQESLFQIERWCEEWGMMLNAAKCAFLRITRKKVFFRSHYFLQNTAITDVAEYKYLGITLNSTLTWSSHVSRICSAAFTKLCFLRRKLRHAPSHVKLLAYNTFVRAKLEYASVVWDPPLKKDIYMLELVQRKAVRFIFLQIWALRVSFEAHV